MIEFNKIEDNSEISYDDTCGVPINNGFHDVLKDYFKEDIDKEKAALNDDNLDAEEDSEIKFQDMFKSISDEILKEVEDDKFCDNNEYEEIQYNEDEDVYDPLEQVVEESKREQEDHKSYLDGLIFIPKQKSELTAYERWLVKKHPEKYKLGIDPRIVRKQLTEKRENKRKKKREKLENMTNEEKKLYLEKKRRKRDLKEYNRNLKDFLDSTNKKKMKKRNKLEEKIAIAYRKQMKDQQPKYKGLKDYFIKTEFKAYKDSLGIGKGHMKFDPYARYRKNSNIISVAEAEAFETDFKNSFMKNLEMELMERLNAPIDVCGQTVVEYYDKKGRLRSKEILNDKFTNKIDKKKLKKNKKKEKKRKEKYVNSIISPNYKDF